ncbi:S-adenosyl-L-methionine-dependent methyltransferase [Lentinus tigrinus ALCF2SS1-7]|uniref:S-adenosyl-L-methionine-dependent methyltransferase n=1 Tax=Lentinus tigrinus ALCF2SS1-6 TaxID=1328759 RepID=A0A5C2SP08_9APHY|nr:S-adenosyl-L-methionine-dependent methyltransferase [Lentinus tigrinus ALCF2SS1-6]RPD79220.1 S-adenosyl-L-methionine-dependent methyltransferase [Lentinus tigrinus ALCF2SS1-7]
MSTPPTIHDLDGIAAIYPHEPEHFSIVRAQVQQRAQLVNTWSIKPGEKVLEIGCGQGDCTVVLATAVGDEGSVTAVDPASLDYGSPYTLGQAQVHLRASSVGHRINFVQADPIGFLQSSSEHYTTAVLAQCSWYFAAPHVFSDILAALLDRVDRICISEYALTSTDYRAMPHILATFAQASLECRKTTSTANVRSMLSPEQLRAAALAVGLAVKAETVMQPPEGMLDGSWEAGYVASKSFEEDVNKYVSDEREKAVCIAARDSVRAARDVLKAKGDRVHTMDIWVATFAKAG